MNLLNFAIIIFIVLETMNVAILYFRPDSKKGNGVAVFNHYHKSQTSEEARLFIKYMINWVAGTKLIFILLLIVILFTGNELTKILSIFSMIIAISTYYFRLDPIIKKIDGGGGLTPGGYSKTLKTMITGFIIMFIIALVTHLLINTI